MLEIERGSTGLNSLENLFWKRLWTCRKTLWNDGEIGNTMRSRCVYKQRIIVIFCRNLKSLFSVLQTVGYIAQDNPYGYWRQLFKHICITIILWSCAHVGYTERKVFLLSELNFYHCYECGLNIVSGEGEGAFRPTVFALQQGSELAFPRLVYLTNSAVTVHCTRNEGCYSDQLRTERSG